MGLDTALQFMIKILEQPLWVQIWVGWLGLVNFSSLIFLRHKPARWVLAAILCSFLLMVTLFHFYGYTRLLGLPHVLFWTPLVAMLIQRWERFTGRDHFGTWIRTVILTNCVSLVFDYLDVLRYLLGDRGEI